MYKKCIHVMFVQKLSKLSGNFQDCPEIFQTARKIFALLETLKTVKKLSRQSNTCLNLLFLMLFRMFRLYFMVNFVNTRKNFPHSEKLYGQQCQYADKVFGTLNDGGPE